MDNLWYPFPPRNPSDSRRQLQDSSQASHRTDQASNPHSPYLRDQQREPETLSGRCWAGGMLVTSYLGGLWALSQSPGPAPLTYSQGKLREQRMFLHSNNREIYQSLQIINAGEGVEKKKTLLYCWWESKLVQPLWRTVWKFLKKLKIELPYDPAIPLLGIYLEKTII